MSINFGKFKRFAYICHCNRAILYIADIYERLRRIPAILLLCAVVALLQEKGVRLFSIHTNYLFLAKCNRAKQAWIRGKITPILQKE